MVYFHYLDIYLDLGFSFFLLKKLSGKKEETRINYKTSIFLFPLNYSPPLLHQDNWFNVRSPTTLPPSLLTNPEEKRFLYPLEGEDRLLSEDLISDNVSASLLEADASEFSLTVFSAGFSVVVAGRWS